MFHALFALSFVGAYVTAESEHWRLLHVALGYGMAALLVFRVLYGLLGPRHARLAPMFRRVAGLLAWARAVFVVVKGWLPGTAVKAPTPLPKTAPGWERTWEQTPNLMRALATATVLLLVAPLTLSGYAVFNEWGDALGGSLGHAWATAFGSTWATDALEEVHGFLGETLALVALAHVALIVGLSLKRRKNQALPMLTGRIEGKGPHLAPQQRVGMAVVLVVVVVAGVVWFAQPVKSSEAGMASAPGRPAAAQVNADD